MKINENKTKVMLFNTCKKLDFTPTVSIENNLEVVEQIKLLGIIITSDGAISSKWYSALRRDMKKLDFF